MPQQAHLAGWVRLITARDLRGGRLVKHSRVQAQTRFTRLPAGLRHDTTSSSGWLLKSV